MPVLVTAILKKIYREKTGRKEWALVSRKNQKKVLKWFGPKKPTKEEVAKEERRVQYWKHVKAQTDVNLTKIRQEARLDKEIEDKIPRTDTGRPRTLSKRILPKGVDKGSKQEALWKAMLEAYLTAIKKEFKREEDRWLIALKLYKIACLEAKVPPFKELVDDEDRTWPIMESKVKKAAFDCLSVAEAVGGDIARATAYKVKVITCPDYRFASGPPCLLFAIKVPKVAGLDFTALKEQAERLGFARDYNIEQRLEIDVKANATWVRKDGIYILHTPKRYIYLVYISPAPYRDATEVPKKVETRLKTLLTRYINTFRGGNDGD